VRRILVILALAAVGATPASAATVPPRATLRGGVCQHALDPAGRGISVTAVMRPLPGTMKMAMRFQLWRRPSRRSKATSLQGRKLGGWMNPTDPPTLGQLPGDVWIVHHPVVDLLVAPALYRFSVSFRWFGSGGRVLATTTKVGPLCFQPELRPDLVVPAVPGLAVTPLANGQDRYSALIRNHGKTAAGPFNVQLAIGGMVVTTQTIAGLAPHTHVTVHFVAPACTAGQQLDVTADPDDRVDDFNRNNNTLDTTCPSPPAATSRVRRHLRRDRA
jgi:hypothetical protein